MQSDKNLATLLNTIVHREGNQPIVIMGDLNRNISQTEQLLSPYNLAPARSHQGYTQSPMHHSWYTRQQAGTFSELDYIAANKPLSNLRSLSQNEPFESDHLLIMTSIQFKDLMKVDRVLPT